MLQGEHSAIFTTSIKLLFVIKVFVLSIFEWPLKTGHLRALSVKFGLSFHLHPNFVFARTKCSGKTMFCAGSSESVLLTDARAKILQACPYIRLVYS